MTGTSPGFPSWSDEVHARLPITPQLVLAGNVDDVHLAPFPGTVDRVGLRATHDVVADRLRSSGYGVVLRWNVVAGLSAAHEANSGGAADVVGSELWGRRSAPTAEDLALTLDRVVRSTRVRAAIVVDGAPRLASEAEAPEAHRLYVTAQFLSLDAPRARMATDPRAGLYNTVVWLVEREADLPHWLVGAGGVRVVSVPKPTMDTRLRASSLLAPALPGFRDLDAAGQRSVVRRLAEHTEGMTLAGVATAVPVAIDRGIQADRVDDAVRFLRSGVQTSPWREAVVRQRIRDSAVELAKVVRGQDKAVRKVVDVLARAALGLSGAQSSGHPTRPQGVLFLAGPTGVGKTELAKRLATVVFGREEAMVRFDMSEFAAEQSEARLLGAPPGYVGHDAGGELTNAVRRTPFCLLLFDEIEKAHVGILDKFLQILEDGRLTDGSGSTVHFTETLIIFTSNLGIYKENEKGEREPRVLPGARYEDVDRTVREAIHAEFVRIGRPELLNRIGDNVVVFDFISATTARELLGRNLNHVSDAVRRRTGSTVAFSAAAVARLEDVVVEPASLAFGGRAVNSAVESRVVNPLARELLMRDGVHDLEVAEVWEDDDGPQVTFTRANGA